MALMNHKSHRGSIRVDISVNPEGFEDLTKAHEEIKEEEVHVKMPENFYKRVMELERELDKKQEKCDDQIVLDLMALFT